mgnify:CR=1 FL=1
MSHTAKPIPYPNTRRILLQTLAATALCFGTLAQAQTNPVKIMVGFPPGGGTDAIARLLADKLKDPLGTSVIVENKAGAGGRLAAQALKAAAPDGHTYLIAPNSVPIFQEILYPRKVLAPLLAVLLALP